MTSRLVRRCSVLMIAFALACGDDDGTTDASTDVPTTDVADTGTDTGDDMDEADVPTDVPVDTGFDAGPPDCSERTLPTLATEMIGNFNQPVFVTAAPDDPDRLYIVEKNGTIRTWKDGTTEDTPFLTVEGINTDGEQGLLGLAFHPDYETNGRFFIFTTPGSPRRDVVDEYRRSDDDPLVADGAMVQRLVELPDGFSNHNGGWIGFGPDGMLYVGLGDEGGANDPNDNGLNTDTLLGSILRLDVDNAAGDFVAAGNPFEDGGGQPQIWAYGVRNVWRASFDRMTGDLYVGDVGQGRVEEIDVLTQDEGGANLGWSAYEGLEVFDADKVDRVEVHHEPVHTYLHGDFEGPSITGGNSVTGGYVYRGEAIPELQGFYLFSDYSSNDIAAFNYCEGEATSVQRLDGVSGGTVVSFGEDGHGEMYIVSIAGPIRRIIAE